MRPSTIRGSWSARAQLVAALPLVVFGLAVAVPRGSWAQATDCAAAPSAERLKAAPAGTPLTLQAASASSTMPSWKEYSFGAKNLTDGDLSTSWQPVSSPGGGVGEWILLRLGGAKTVRFLGIANGMQRQDRLGDLFTGNNRVKEFCLELSDGTSMRLELPDGVKGFTYFSLNAKRTESIKLKAISIYRGEKWNDLAVSEVVVFGDDASSSPAPAAGAVQRSSESKKPEKVAAPPPDPKVDALLFDIRESLLKGDAARANTLAQQLSESHPELRELWAVQAAFAQLGGSNPAE